MGTLTFSHPPPLGARSGAARCRGFGLVEMLLSLVILAIAVLGYASLVFNHHSAARSVESHGRALQAVREFTERLRASDDWSALYTRCCALEDEAQDAAHPDARLSNGLYGLAPSAYFPGFAPPPGVENMRVLVRVPRAVPAGAGNADAPRILREDVTDPAFDLPADLNADGVIDSEAHDGDNVVLPVELVFRWNSTNVQGRECRMRTWLRGRR